MDDMRYDKCQHCEDYPYVTDKNRKEICYRCDLEDALDKLKVELKQTWMYKFLVRCAEWLNRMLGARNK